MNNLSLRTKLLVGGVAIPAVILAILFGVFYHSEKKAVIEEFVNRSRLVTHSAEAVRINAEAQWDKGLFNTDMLRELAESGRTDEMLMAVPVFSAWTTAMEKAQENDYTFKAPKFSPRNPNNEPDELEARALNTLKQDNLTEYYEINDKTNSVHFFLPVRLSRNCLACHGDPSTSQALWGNSRGLDPTGAHMEGWAEGELHGAFEVIYSLDEADAQLAATMRKAGLLLVGVLAILGGLIWFFLNTQFMAPLNKILGMLRGLRAGNLGERLQSDRTDELGDLSNDLDAFADDLQHQILTAFDKLAAGDFTFQTEGLIAKPLAQTNQAMSNLIGQISVAGDEIAGAAHEVSNSSTHLSENATTSASSLQEINASMQEMTGQVNDNAHNAASANQISVEARDGARHGSRQMNEMVSAMQEISESSESISNIIKVIDDIAFQTNLLALNAAVEAARAGKAGKGFAVVAEEVRNLAGRSAKAARETAELIEVSVEKTQKGSEIAGRTAEALDAIVTGVTKVSDLVAEIDQASKNQAQGINEVTAGLDQIDNVTQQNTAVAEESAAAAMELSSQAANMKEMLATFKLKGSPRAAVAARPAAQTPVVQTPTVQTPTVQTPTVPSPKPQINRHRATKRQTGTPASPARPQAAPRPKPAPDPISAGAPEPPVEEIILLTEDNWGQ